MTFDAINMKA